MMKYICLCQDSWIDVHINLEKENRVKVGHEHDNWNEIYAPDLEVFVASWH